MDFVNNSTKFAHIIANPSENASQIISHRTKLIEDVNVQIGKNLADDIKVIKNNFSSKETDEEFPEEMVGKLHKICRCCLAEDVKLRDIYDENERIAEMLMNFAQIQISPEDILPPVICINCCVQIERVYEFKNQIEMAESTLRQLVNANSYQVVQ
uniref:ZAD domain-containing protein n=1 Tax=Lutzomyia longipalpis TaxID=7200 RepID=A0A1B0CUQ6_LUTLO